MKFIIDAQLPHSLCYFFDDCDCIHTSKLEKGNQTRDSFINEISIKEKRIVITKDTDFYYSYLASQKPYKLVLVKPGNLKLTAVKDYFKRNAQKLMDMLNEHSFVILEKDRIRVLQ